ncbi:unnamed protein product [Nezara viridula]|uniref:Uncharacterized protein n=1 Tax=Nezara viridula TaxID=85310 RepID=A0A9P0H6X8_NEZVI|nr:unnamed protein product [Nezara viridula]
MDHNQWNRNVIEHRIEQWREQRAQKMAARLQLHSTKPRTISSNVLGYVNYRQPMTLQPGFRQQHGEGPRFNSHGDQRWNPNYNYSGYREHHSPHKQYHQADHRNHGYGHGSYHQQHGQKKGGHFSSHKSLYNDRKSTNKPNKRFSSSCNSINNTTEVGNQNVVCPSEQFTAIANENAGPSSNLEVNVDTHQVNSECSENMTAVVENALNVEEEIEKGSDSDERFQESSLPESDRLQENTVSEAVDTLQNSELNENHLPEPQSCIDSCVPVEEDVISNISVLEPPINSSEEEPTLFIDATSSIALNVENSDEITVAEAEAIPELRVEVNDPETFEQSAEILSSEIDQKEELQENTPVELVCEQVVKIPENPTVHYECTDEEIVTNVEEIVTNVEEIVTNVEEISAIEQTASSEINSDAANETLDLELNLSFKPEIEIVVEDTEEPVDPLQLNADEVVDSASNELSNNEEASIIRYEDISTESDHDLSREIERVENKLANISIVNKEEVTSNEECFTPMKRERRQVLLDATNILPTSTIKFAVREVRKNDETEVIVTPVRRSARLSTLTPVSAHKNICVQKLEELSPEVIQKMKFIQNPAIENPPDC